MVADPVRRDAGDDVGATVSGRMAVDTQSVVGETRKWFGCWVDGYLQSGASLALRHGTMKHEQRDLVLTYGESVDGVPQGSGPQVRMKQSDGSIRTADTLLLRAVNRGDGGVYVLVVGFNCAAEVTRLAEMASAVMTRHGSTRAKFTRVVDGWRVSAASS